MRLIDADALKASVPETSVDIFEYCRKCKTLMDWEVKKLIDDAPTIDAVPVVRCKDCKWFINDHNEVDGWMTCTLLRQEVDKEWFCRSGERKPK